MVVVTGRHILGGEGGKGGRGSDGLGVGFGIGRRGEESNGASVSSGAEWSGAEE